MPPLRVHRIAAGLTQVELAALAGCSGKTISNIERRFSRPHPTTARAVAAALGCTPDDLFPDDERRPDRGGAVTRSAGQGPTDGP